MSTPLVVFQGLEPADGRSPPEVERAHTPDLLNEAKAAIREVDPPEAEELLERGGVVFLDVREPDEYEQGAIPNAVHLPRGHLEFQVEGKLSDKSGPVVVYCAGGVRSAFRGQDDAGPGLPRRSVPDWRFQPLEGRRPPLGHAQTLTPAQRNRYQRHLLLPEVGEKGQLKLLDSKVLLLGEAVSVRQPRCTWPQPAWARSA